MAQKGWNYLLTHAIVKVAKALGDDSTGQGNIKEWRHTNKSKSTNEHTKHKPRLNTQKFGMTS